MKNLQPYSLRSNLAALLVGAALALGATAATQAAPIVITVTGTVRQADAGMGYTVGQNVSFQWLLNDYAPQTPVGSRGGSAGSYTYSWTQENVGSEPKLWSNVGGSGISGTYQEGSGGTPFDRLQVSQLKVATPFQPFSIYMKTDGFSNADNRGLYLSSDSSLLVQSLDFAGNIVSPFPENSFDPTLPNPVTYLNGYAGTYSATNLSNTSFYLTASNGLSGEDPNYVSKTAYFTVTSVSWGVPDTGPQGLLAVGAMGLMVALRRRQSGV
jgi:hypothetical protein